MEDEKKNALQALTEQTDKFALKENAMRATLQRIKAIFLRKETTMRANEVNMNNELNMANARYEETNKALVQKTDIIRNINNTFQSKVKAVREDYASNRRYHEVPMQTKINDLVEQVSILTCRNEQLEEKCTSNRQELVNYKINWSRQTEEYDILLCGNLALLQSQNVHVDPGNCVICSTPIPGGIVKGIATLHCGHHYHTQCLIKLVRQQDPTARGYGSNPQPFVSRCIHTTFSDGNNR